MGASYEKALILYQQKRFELARDELAKDLSEAPNSARAHALMSLCLISEKKYKLAREAAERAIAIDPQSSFAHHALAQTFYFDEKYTCRRESISQNKPVELRRRGLKMAAASAREALRLAPTDAGIHGIMAFILHDMGKPRACMREALEGLRFDPTNAGCLRAQALAARSLERIKDAVSVSAKAVSAHPQGAIEHAIHGRMLLLAGRRDEGQAHLDEAMRLDPTARYVRSAYLDGLRMGYWPYRLPMRCVFALKPRQRIAAFVLFWPLTIFAPIYLAAHLSDRYAVLSRFGGLLIFLGVLPGILFLTSAVCVDFFLQFKRSTNEFLSRDQRLRSNIFILTGVGLAAMTVRDVAKSTAFELVAERAWWLLIFALVAIFVWLRRRDRHSV